MTKTIRFDELPTQSVPIDEIVRKYSDITTAFDHASDTGRRVEVLREWDDFERKLETWGSMAYARFTQDTRNEEYKRARDEYDELSPKMTEAKLNFVRKILESPHRSTLESELGSYLFERWDCEVLTYDPAIEQHKVKEAKLRSEYEGLLGSAEIEFRGEMYNLSTLGKFGESADRSTRHESHFARWSWFSDNADQLDRIFDDLVRLRVDMASTLGFASYTDLGYRIMTRTDYGPAEVARYRDAVREHVVPVATEIRQRQAETLGVDKLMFWDEAVFDPKGNPHPIGHHDDLVAAAQTMFESMGHGLGEFFQLMVDSRLMDLEERKGKAVGGYCTDLGLYRVPFIFANFNGTKHDVEVFTHEMGHAYQCYQSRAAFPVDLWWPTSEAAEIHSMGLEFLTWPYMEQFFGEGGEADRFRRIHLMDSLLFLPYGVAVDHFQHLVYESPGASPSERHAMWQEVENLYLPGRDYGDLGRCVQGGFWQRQTHIYKSPFYYIDYTLALACALQFWVRSRRDRDATMSAYVELCGLGGGAPFQQLVASAGLTSPFESGCLEEVVDQAQAFLAE